MTTTPPAAIAIRPMQPADIAAVTALVLATPLWQRHGVDGTDFAARLAQGLDAAATILAAIADAPKDRPQCLIFGGETTVKLRGDGLGGRNQELALRVAMAMPEMGNNWVFLSGGSDGRDGPTDAAGGLVDKGTLARMRTAGKDPDALLANNDSNAALAAAGDLLITGATGTNVADVQIFLCRCV